MPGGVVGGAEVDDVHLAFGQGRDEIIFCGGGHIIDVAPTTGLGVVLTGTAAHGVGVQIDGVDGVAQRNFIIHIEQVADIAAVALGAIGDEDLIGLDIHTARGEIMGGNGFPQEIIALVPAIAAERLRCAHLVNGFVHSLDDCGGQGAGDVADAQLDELGVRMCGE